MYAHSSFRYICSFQQSAFDFAYLFRFLYLNFTPVFFWSPFSQSPNQLACINRAPVLLLVDSSVNSKDLWQLRLCAWFFLPAHTGITVSSARSAHLYMDAITIGFEGDLKAFKDALIVQIVGRILEEESMLYFKSYNYKNGTMRRLKLQCELFGKM